jgi:hypothetical protein
MGIGLPVNTLLIAESLYQKGYLTMYVSAPAPRATQEFMRYVLDEQTGQTAAWLIAPP